MDQLGKQSLIKIADRLDLELPQKPSTLHNIILAGDVLSNAVYYSLVPSSSGDNLWKRSTFLGLLAGVESLVLPKPLGLEPQKSNRTSKTQLLTIGLYLSGALITGLTYRKLTGDEQSPPAVKELNLLNQFIENPCAQTNH